MATMFSGLFLNSMTIVKHETINPGCYETNVLSQNESSLLGKVADISNL